MAQLVSGYRLTQLVHVAAKLNLASLLRSSPATASDLASQTGTDPDALYRLLRALAGLGVFSEEANKLFRLTPLGETLLPDVRGSQYREALVAGEPFMWESWGNLLYSVKTRGTAFEHVFGKPTFEWFKDHPEQARLFDEFQAENTRASSLNVARAYDFSSARTIVDIGGGNGQLLSEILALHSSPKAILFDLQHVVDAAKSKPLPHLASRCEFLGGDFFQSVPGAADLYLLKYILHDWDDDKALGILRKCVKLCRRPAGCL